MTRESNMITAVIVGERFCISTYKSTTDMTTLTKVNQTSIVTNWDQVFGPFKSHVSYGNVTEDTVAAGDCILTRPNFLKVIGNWLLGIIFFLMKILNFQIPAISLVILLTSTFLTTLINGQSFSKNISFFYMGHL